MTVHHTNDVHTAVREHYGRAAAQATGCGCASTCCTDTAVPFASFGPALYGLTEKSELPPAAVLASLGCGNPTALADLSPGQVVLDLGSGGGIDVLLSAKRVGPTGKAYGLDMTPQMHDLALRNQAEAGLANAEFLLGTIEDIPLPDSSVDVIISNCVVNLSPDKPAVFREAYRVLRPGGRLAISDIVTVRALNADVAHLMGLWTGCVAGAMTIDAVRAQLEEVGFVEADVELVNVYARAELQAMATDLDLTTIHAGIALDATLDALQDTVASGFIRALKP